MCTFCGCCCYWCQVAVCYYVVGYYDTAYTQVYWAVVYVFYAGGYVYVAVVV